MEVESWVRQRHVQMKTIFFKHYGTKNTNDIVWKGDERPFRKWTWKVTEIISDLPDVSKNTNFCSLLFFFVARRCFNALTCPVASLVQTIESYTSIDIDSRLFCFVDGRKCRI